MKKIKILITAFIIFSILSLDLGAVFSGQATSSVKTEQASEENLFTIEHFKYNVGCIGKKIGSVVCDAVSGAAKDTAKQYAEKVADSTTKSIEKTIEKKQNNMNVQKTNKKS